MSNGPSELKMTTAMPASIVTPDSLDLGGERQQLFGCRGVRQPVDRLREGGYRGFQRIGLAGEILFGGPFDRLRVALYLGEARLSCESTPLSSFRSPRSLTDCSSALTSEQ